MSKKVEKEVNPYEGIQPLEHKPMHCPVCGKRFMNFAGQPLENHACVRCNLTNGVDQLDIPVCTECLESMTVEKLKAVYLGILEYWDWQVDTDVTKDEKQKAKEKAWNRSYIIQDIKQIIRTAEAHKFDKLQKQLDEEKKKEKKVEE